MKNRSSDIFGFIIIWGPIIVSVITIGLLVFLIKPLTLACLVVFAVFATISGIALMVGPRTQWPSPKFIGFLITLPAFAIAVGAFVLFTLLCIYSISVAVIAGTSMGIAPIILP
jgi:hypothetical protein